MARLRDSRSPSPAGSSRRYRRDDDRRRDRDRDRRHRSRTPPRQRDDFRRRDRSLDRNNTYQRDGRDRRRSRDRYADSGRDRDRDREKDRRDRDDRRRRDNSRDRLRAPREGTADSHRSGPADVKAKATTEAADVKPKPVPTSSAVPSDADKKAERLAKLAAWKKKQEDKEKAKEATPGGTRKLLAEMDEKANGSSVASPTVASPAAAPPSVDSPAAAPSPAGDGSMPSPATPYAGKFDPKQIAKKSARVHDTNGAPKLDTIGAQLPTSKLAMSTPDLPKASALPKAKTSGFGFHKQNAETEKVTQKRKLILDEEETIDRKLAKLPSLPLPDVDDTPYEVEDEDEGDDDNFAGDEEEEAAAARAAQERREERIAQESAHLTNTMDIDDAKEEESAPLADAVGEVMEVDHEDDEDPLDAFMNDLESKPVPAPKPRVVKPVIRAQPDQEPEAYFSGDDDYDYAKKDDEPGAFLDKVNKARKKKDIPTIDYSKLDLAPLRKNFWVEPAELSEMTEAELTDLRLELDGIKVSGKNVPKPVQKWSQCALSRRTLDIIDSLGFDKPTSIQMQAFPAIMSGRDIIGIAKTGSGKTLAFLLPMFRHIKDQAPLKENDGPIGLIMTPTRELATQIHRDCKPFLKSMGLRAVCAYGGAPIKDHIAELKRGAEIVVCTPGRMIDLLAANQGRVTNLKRVTYVVLDEADRMFDMGFEPQVMKILNNMRPDRQNILFSATMPRIMDSLAKKILTDPVEITVGGRSVVAAEITQIVEVRDEDKKFVRLLELLGVLYDRDEDARTLVFVERQERADQLLKELLQKGYPCMSIHGGKDQVDRNSTISDFKAGVVPIMIATSVAARGLDVKQLMLVVNYDAPNHLEDYVHRAGRTGRAGNKGTAVTFVTSEQESSAFCIAKALEQSGQPVPDSVKTMQQSFQEKLKAGKARDSSGFGGKGLDRLDQEREAARLRERKTHRTEGEEEEENVEEKAAEDKKADKALSAIQAAASAVSSRDSAPAPAPTPQPDLEPKFVIHKREVPPPGTNNNPLDKVSSARDAINARLGKSGQLRPGQPIDNKGPDAGAFHATLEINDFPQKARWAVTNRTNVAKILESTGVSITTKGTFYAAGKEVPPGGEAKLYILVEGDTEVVVSDAMTELTRLLKQGTIAAADAESRAPMGRYNVV